MHFVLKMASFSIHILEKNLLLSVNDTSATQPTYNEKTFEEEQKLLEQALKTFPASYGAERWDKIAECLPNRSKKDCMRRYEELAELIRAKKAAQAAAAKGK